MVMHLADLKKVVVLVVSTTKRVVASGLIRSENKSGILKKMCRSVRSAVQPKSRDAILFPFC